MSALEPRGCEVVSHDLGLEALKAWVFNFIESMAVEDWDKRVVICDEGEMGEACKEEVALYDGP